MQINPSITQEAVFLGISLLLGVGLFFLYDIFRIFRRIVPHGNVWIALEDICYWMVCTAAVFVMLYQENDGMVRGFALGGIVLGMLCYYCLFSRLVIRLHVAVLRAVLGVLRKIFGFFYKIFSFLFRPFCRVGKKGGGFLKKQLKKAVKAFKIGISKH